MPYPPPMTEEEEEEEELDWGKSFVSFGRRSSFSSVVFGSYPKPHNLFSLRKPKEEEEEDDSSGWPWVSQISKLDFG